MATVNDWYKGAVREHTEAERLASLTSMQEALIGTKALGRVAQTYLESRGCWRPEWLSEVSWNESPWHGMVAQIRRKPGGPVMGIQITALTPDSQKVARRNMGAMDGGAIWIGEGNPPLHEKPGCIIGEGLETVLSAMILSGKTQGMACMSWANMIKAPILDHWDVVLIAQDNDEYGEKAARGLTARLKRLKKPRLIVTRVPNEPGQDWNDVLTGLGG